MKDHETFQTDAFQILDAALAAVDPFKLLIERVQRNDFFLHIGEEFRVNLSPFTRIFVFGAGKGVVPMARAMESILAGLITAGQVITKYGHSEKTKKIKVTEAGHPLPDQNTLQASAELLNTGLPFTANDLVIFLLTGGGSTLLESLPDDLTLDDLRSTNDILLGCGATIQQINTVRKHLSEVKGGQLLRHFSPAQVVTLILSDVIGDDPAEIASGPTAPDNSTFEEAIQICEQLNILGKLPARVQSRLINGAAEIIKETPAGNDQIFQHVHNIILGNNRHALVAAERMATRLGYASMLYTSALQGEAREVARVIAALMTEVAETDKPLARPACLLFGGETTVTLNGKGKGGRNQELALALAACHLNFEHVFISCGSDGTDGPTDAAGALTTHNTYLKASLKKLDIQHYLEANDSYTFFEILGDLIKTGPTGTNVMDLMIALIPA